VIALFRQRFGEISADACTGARNQDRLVIVRSGGVRRRDKNDCDGNNKLEELIHGVYLFFSMAVTLAQSDAI
jgi:hypothetical protein